MYRPTSVKVLCVAAATPSFGSCLGLGVRAFRVVGDSRGGGQLLDVDVEIGADARALSENLEVVTKFGPEKPRRSRTSP
jgi:hypothetical protein